MAKPPLTDSERDFAIAPSNVRVTVFRLPDDRGLGRRSKGLYDRIPTWLRKVAFAGLVGIVGAMLAGAFGVDGNSGTREAIWGVREPGRSGVAAAYGYPTTCLRVRISAINPAFARADADHSGSCGYDIGFPTALFRRFNGEWHPVLYVISYRCPLPSIPAPVQSQLSLCSR